MAKRSYQWERDFAAAAGRVAPINSAYERLVVAAFARYDTDSHSLRGWHEIAAFMRCHERNARRAYAMWPAFRRCIIKRGGRYFGNPGALINLQHDFLNRREGRLKPKRRGEIARKRVRARRGQFK